MNYKEGLREQLGEEINIKICLNSGQFQEIGNIQLQGNFNIVLQFLQVQGSRYGTQVGVRYKILGRNLGRNQVQDSRQVLRQELGTRFQVGTQVGTRYKILGRNLGRNQDKILGRYLGRNQDKILGRYLGRSQVQDSRQILRQKLQYCRCQEGTGVGARYQLPGRYLGTKYCIDKRFTRHYLQYTIVTSQ